MCRSSMNLSEPAPEAFWSRQGPGVSQALRDTGRPDVPLLCSLVSTQERTGDALRTATATGRQTLPSGSDTTPAFFSDMRQSLIRWLWGGRRRVWVSMCVRCVAQGNMLPKFEIQKQSGAAFGQLINLLRAKFLDAAKAHYTDKWKTFLAGVSRLTEMAFVTLVLKVRRRPAPASAATATPLSRGPEHSFLTVRPVHYGPPSHTRPDQNGRAKRSRWLRPLKPGTVATALTLPVHCIAMPPCDPRLGAGGTIQCTHDDNNMTIDGLDSVYRAVHGGCLPPPPI